MSQPRSNQEPNFTNPTLLVAVGLGSTDAHLINAANELVAKLDARVHLVHCVEPSPAAAWIETYYAPEVKLDLVRVQEAQAALKEIAKQIRSSVPPTSRVVVADAAYGITAEAASIGAALIVCGAKNVSHRHLLAVLSPVLGVMSAATTPVLVMREDIAPERFRGTWSLVAADDLQPTSLRALAFACGLAVQTKAEHLLHATIDPPRPMESLKEGMHGFFGTHWPDEAVEAPFNESFEERRPGLEAALADRVKPHRARLDAASCQYQSFVCHGDVSDEMARIVRDTAPTAVVVGHHSKIHGRPLRLGRMPLAALLEFAAPVLVVP